MSRGGQEERSLRDSGERLNTLLKTIPHGIQENDSSGILTYSNRAHHEMLGIRKDIPIVLCTGFTLVITEEEARASGIRDMVMKPLGRDGFAKVINKVLG